MSETERSPQEGSMATQSGITEAPSEHATETHSGKADAPKPVEEENVITDIALTGVDLGSSIFTSARRPEVFVTTKPSENLLSMFGTENATKNTSSAESKPFKEFLQSSGGSSYPHKTRNTTIDNGPDLQSNNGNKMPPNVTALSEGFVETQLTPTDSGKQHMRMNNPASINGTNLTITRSEAAQPARSDPADQRGTTGESARNSIHQCIVVDVSSLVAIVTVLSRTNASMNEQRGSVSQKSQV